MIFNTIPVIPDDGKRPEEKKIISFVASYSVYAVPTYSQEVPDLLHRCVARLQFRIVILESYSSDLCYRREWQVLSFTIQVNWLRNCQ